jgi:hypothetical protein
MKTESRSLKDCWKNFRVGDHLEDDELIRMYNQIKAGLSYLEDRLPEYHLAWVESIHDQNILRDYICARGLGYRIKKLTDADIGKNEEII